MEKIKIKKISKLVALLDHLLLPVVKVLGKLNADSIQETHSWHLQQINPNLVNRKMALRMPSDDKSIHQKYRLFLFHAPLLGGWTKYTVYEVGPEIKLPFYVGWTEYNSDGSVEKTIVHKLPIYKREIRLLNGTPFFHVEAFALSSDGVQVSIKSSDKGVLGENKDSDIRLF